MSLAKDSVTKIENSNSQNFANLFIVISQSEFDSANSTKQTILKITNSSLRGIALTYLASLYLREKDIPQAIITTEEALEHSNGSPQAYINTWLNILIANLFTTLERPNDSHILIMQALQTLPLIQEHNTRSELYSLIAQSRLRNGDREEAEKILSKAIVEVKEVQDPYLKSLALSFISLTHYDLGFMQRSLSYQELAIQHAKKAPQPSKSVALAFLSTIQAKTGRDKAALDVLNDVLQRLPTIQTPYHRAISLTFMAQTLFLST